MKTPCFVPVPYESENLIKSISRNLSKDFRYYKLKIVFGEHFGNPASDTLNFDPIVSVQLFNWWEPSYDAMMRSKATDARRRFPSEIFSFLFVL